MLKSHEKFHSENGKRLILIADDEFINREILGAILENDYEVIFAEDGEETLQQCRTHREILSLVLLDLMMPVMPGIEVLKNLREDEDLRNIPVIVMTADQNSEVDCLRLGASDFIPKPYPQEAVIKARIHRTIELFEDREIINHTERDPLTGLYNREYFYRYAEQFDHHHPNLEMDAIVVDVNHFHMINERFGTDYGDGVLRRIGERVRQMVADTGGIVCRREADTFLVYCPHGKDYDAILRSASMGLMEDETITNQVHLRMGVYPDVDRSLEIERRFDRAQMAADKVRGSYAKQIGLYDSSLHQKELYEEQLIEDFRTAISERQFVVYYQPKFDVRNDLPVLSSAEALVRWQHPTMGLISPGIFIPLFESNGMIQELDQYVWETVGRQIRIWKDRLGFSCPVSVNISRIDMYDPKLIATLQSILKENDLSYEELLLEVTESAYVMDSEQIIQTAHRLRKLGFLIEMDDFGTGYSSLNMISKLPIDALKLDMQFIRNAFSNEGDTKILEVIIGIADYLSVPVIAEGVETKEQMCALRDLGCDIVQGYYFSRPIPADEFEAILLSAKTAAVTEKTSKDAAAAQNADGNTGNKMSVDKAGKNVTGAAGTGTAGTTAVSGRSSGRPAAENGNETDRAGASPIPISAPRGLAPLPTDPPDSEPAEFDTGNAGEIGSEQKENADKKYRGLQLRTTSYFFVVISLIAALALFISDVFVTRGYRRMERASNRYIVAQLAASNMEAGSDYLTDRVRCFVVTGELEYLQDFFEELNVTRRRDQALDDLEELLEGSGGSAYTNLATALSLSNELVDREYEAMQLILEAGDYPAESIPPELSSMTLSAEDMAMTPEEQVRKAQNLVFDNAYMHYKDRIRENVNLCTQELIRSASLELETASAQMALHVNLQTFLTIAFLVLVLLIVWFINSQVRRPLSHLVEQMRRHEVLDPAGAEELQFVTRTYNKILDENREARERLSHEASHDRLTGLFNRGAYEMMLESVDTDHMALILVDVDYFKSVNDTFGHDMGDRVLKRVAEILKQSFRSVDVICRIGGDEFVVIMTRADSSMRDLVKSKIDRANYQLQHPTDDLPPISLSVGVAFADRDNARGDIFKDADTALYRVKEAGRCGCEIF